MENKWTEIQFDYSEKADNLLISRPGTVDTSINLGHLTIGRSFGYYINVLIFKDLSRKLSISSHFLNNLNSVEVEFTSNNDLNILLVKLYGPGMIIPIIHSWRDSI